jgi:DNA topoisomerase-3
MYCDKVHFYYKERSNPGVLFILKPKGAIGMTVIYAEKHSLAKAIAAALGAKVRSACEKDKTIGHWEFDFDGEPAVICHGAGHLGTLANAVNYGEEYKHWDLEAYPCIPDSFTVCAIDHAQTCLDYVKGFFEKADRVINACDPDREGELIFGYVYQLTGCDKPWKRAWIEDLTEEKIKKAFMNLKDSAEVLPLQQAGRARAVADWLIGINLTIAATVKFGGERMNVGRVQTPTLALVVNREREIKEHIKTPFWKLTGLFSFSEQDFTADYEVEKFDTEAEARKALIACTGNNGIVTAKEVKRKTVSAPLLYNSTGLQIAAAEKLGFDAAKTEKIMQELYLKQLISYPRTSSEHLTESMKSEIEEIIDKLLKIPEYGEYAPLVRAEFTARHFDDKKVGSHPAITPTQNVPETLTDDELDEDGARLYDLIAKSVLRLIHGKAEEEETKLTLDVSGNVFKSSGTSTVTDGWYAVDAAPERKKVIPFGIKEGDSLPGKYEMKKGETKPQERFTEATLLKTMELAGQNIEDEELKTLMKLQKKGLGTDATRVPTIKGLYAHDLLSKKGKSVIPTEKGMFLIGSLPVSELKSAELTGEWEKTLNDIAEGKDGDTDGFINEIKDKTREWFKVIAEAPGGLIFIPNGDDKLRCPLCNNEIKTFDWGYGCAGYKTGCKFSVRKNICGVDITENHVKMLCTVGTTDEIYGFVGKSGSEFAAALTLDRKKGNIVFDFPQKDNKKK